LVLQYEHWGSKWRAQLFAVILLFSTLFTVGPLVAQLLIDPSISAELNLLFGILILQVLTGLAWRLRSLTFAINLFCFGSWLTTIAAMLYSGGISGPLASTQIYVLLFTALLTSTRATVITLILTGIVNLATLYLETSNLLPESILGGGMTMHLTVQIAITTLTAATIMYANQTQRYLTLNLSKNERKFRALFEKSSDAVILISLDLRVIEVNEAGATLLGYAPKELAGLPIKDLFPAEEWPEVQQRLETVSARQILSPTRRSFVTKAGDIVILETNLALVTDEHGHPMHYQSIGRDITSTVLEEQRMRSTLAHMTMRASTDVLTGLLNREAVMQHAQAEWERYVREGVPMSIMLVDMDGLKTINDTHGHMVGDAALKALGKVLENNKRPYDWLGRLGGDEFMLVLPGADLDDAQHILSRMRSAANSKTIRTGMDEIRLSSSMGIASTAGSGEPPRAVNELVERADQALYAAKRRVRSAVN
jgi:diguanylate cyclase (GGDEF)-like protein/PAS domain S-box-containing protein